MDTRSTNSTDILSSILNTKKNKKQSKKKEELIKDNENKLDSTINKNQIEWKNWTDKSKDISFKSTIKGVGDGEQKVAHEFDTKILGQNSYYDMKVTIDRIEYESDIKKLDNNTFNTGVKGRNALRPIKTKITNLLNLFRKIVDSKILTQEIIIILQNFEEVSPDELCVKNIQKLYKVCYILHEERQKIILRLPNIPFIINGIIVEINLLQYYNILNILERDLEEEFYEFKDILLLLNDLAHEYIMKPDELYNSLNSLVSIFLGIKLIFVDEKKGYFILDNILNIKFERITRGHPRFRLLV